MEYTKYQLDALRYKGYSKVFFHKNMYRQEHCLGYSISGSPYDLIHIAEDCPTEDIKKIVILHEVGHIVYSHVYVNIKKEIKFIKSIFESNGVPYQSIMKFGGPMQFLNICMDLEVNTKLLSKGNINTMNEYFKICTPEIFGVPVLDNFRDYYPPLIEKLKKELAKESSEKSNSKVDSDEQNPSSGGLGDIFDKDSENGGNNSEEGTQGGRGNSNNETKDIEDALRDMLRDIRESVSPFDDEFKDDKDISNALQKESYSNDNLKEKKNQNKNIPSQDVMEALGIEDSPNREDSQGRAYSNRKSNEDTDTLPKYDVIPNDNRCIQRFLNKILGSTNKYLPDSMSIHNRGTRGNSNILYSSLKRKHTVDKVKLGILIDVSLSMRTEEVLKAIGTFQKSTNIIDNNSNVVLWDDRLIDEFNIRRIPNKVKTGTYTDIASGMEYLAKKGYKDILVYSDYFTNMREVNKVVKKYGLRVRSIIVGDVKEYVKGAYYQEDFSELKKLLKDNKDFICVTYPKEEV